MNPCPKAAMREIRPSGLMSGIWKRAPRYRARSRLYTSQSSREIFALLTLFYVYQVCLAPMITREC